MSTSIRAKGPGRWLVDVYIKLADGTRFRERRVPPVGSRADALAWGQALEHKRYGELLSGRVVGVRGIVPRLADIEERFLAWAVAERQKPSEVRQKSMILRLHLLPELGDRKLDEIGTAEIDALKATLASKGLSAKYTNNVMAVLSAMLTRARRWRLIAVVPEFEWLRARRPEASFHGFEEYERLVECAARDGIDTLVMVLLAGDAGLRSGELRALEWRDVDVALRQVRVSRSDWIGHVGLPKNGRRRVVPLTARLVDVLARYRHLRGARVLLTSDGKPYTEKAVRVRVERAARRANVRPGVHLLRHTFASHLSMRGVPPRAIQELLGHADLSMVQRYAHLSPAAVEEAIRTLETGASWHSRGIGEVGRVARIGPDGS